MEKQWKQCQTLLPYGAAEQGTSGTPLGLPHKRRKAFTADENEIGTPQCWCPESEPLLSAPEGICQPGIDSQVREQTREAVARPHNFW